MSVIWLGIASLVLGGALMWAPYVAILVIERRSDRAARTCHNCGERWGLHPWARIEHEKECLS